MYNNYEDYDYDYEVYMDEYDCTTMYEVIYRYDGIEFNETVTDDTYQWILENADLRKVKRIYK